MKIVGARSAPTRFTGRLNRRQQQPDEHAQDGDHDEQLHQREAAKSSQTNSKAHTTTSLTDEKKTCAAGPVKRRI
jgi:hypothetical protein